MPLQRGGKRREHMKARNSGACGPWTWREKQVHAEQLLRQSFSAPCSAQLLVASAMLALLICSERRQYT
eukprot:1191156-Rhodomonas_salina.2